jgi:hypothetical protein
MVEDIDELQPLVPEIDLFTHVRWRRRAPLCLMMSGVAEPGYDRMAVCDADSASFLRSTYGEPIQFNSAAKITILRWLKENKKENNSGNGV